MTDHRLVEMKHELKNLRTQKKALVQASLYNSTLDGMTMTDMITQINENITRLNGQIYDLEDQLRDKEE